MSVVVSLKLEDEILFISDSLSTSDRYSYSHINEEDAKSGTYFEDNHALIAHVGDCRDISIIKNIPHLFDDFDKSHTKFDYKYVRDKLIPHIRKEYYDLALIPDDETYEFPTILMVAKDDKCFTITSNGGIIEVEDFDVNGCGFYSAMSVICFSRTKDKRLKAIEAVAAAIRHNARCGYPILVSSTKTGKTEILSTSDVAKLLAKKKEGKD